ncbi:endonuclease/exonuclease/phosphatase family protein [Peptococcaceae bacterium 1198_IL3148]
MSVSLRVLTHNIRHGLGLDNKVSLERIAWNILTSKAEICGIQEVDRFLPRSGLINQAKSLANLCGMSYAFGANVGWSRLAAYGTAILSRYPIIAVHNYPLPGTGEKRGLLKVVIEKDNLIINFFTTHLTLNAEERIAQVAAINEVLATVEGPVILTGDFNEEVTGKAVSLLLSGGMFNCLPQNGADIPTYPATNPQKQIDYIFAKGQWQVALAKVINSRGSDHLPYLVQLKKAED